MATEKVSGIVAFDYGTSTSTVTIIKNDEIEYPLPSGNGGLMSSAVYVYKDKITYTTELNPKAKKGAVLLQNTKRLLGKHKRDFVSSMLMGGDYGAEVQYDERERLYFNCDVGDKKNPEYRRVYPEEVFYVLLEYVITESAKRLEDEITSICLTIPHYTTDNARFLMRQQVAKFGLQCSFMIKEPTAAGIPYLLPNTSTSKAVVKEGENILVFDFGGGTLDITIIHRSGDSYKVTGSGGDPTLGGATIDAAISDYVIMEYKKQGIGLLGNSIKKLPEKGMKLRTLCRDAKECLSGEETCEIVLNDFVKKEEGEEEEEEEEEVYTLSRNIFESIIMKPIIEKCKQAYRKVLQASKTDSKNINHVLLVGGSSKIPCIKDIFRGKHILGDENYHPQQAVAIGAATAAKHNLVVNNLEEIMESTIGVMVYDKRRNKFTPHIREGTSLPTKTPSTYILTPEEDKYDLVVYRDVGGRYHQEGYITLNNLLRKDEKKIEITVYIEATVDGALKYTVRDSRGMELGKENIYLG